MVELVDSGVETGFPVGDVVDLSDAAVGLDQAVLTFDDVAVAFFPLVFLVAGVRVVDAVFESVPGVVVLQIEINVYYRQVLHNGAIGAVFLLFTLILLL